MFRLDFLYEFRYRYLGNIEAPFILVKLKHLDNEVDALALLDSGAEHSLFHYNFGQDLGLDLLSGPFRGLTGLAGGTVQASFHRLLLVVEGREIQCEVGFPRPDLYPDPESKRFTRNLLGRSFFAQVKVGFREYYQTFYLDTSP